MTRPDRFPYHGPQAGGCKAEDRLTFDRTIRYLYLRFLRIRKDPEEIARGLAVGTVVGLSPFFGLHMLLAVALAMLVKGNKFMAVLATWIGNPVTFSVILYADYKVGRWLLGGRVEPLRRLSLHPYEVLHAGWDILAPLTVGGLVVGVLAAVPVYFLLAPLIGRLSSALARRRS